MQERRSKFEIIYEILSEARNPTSKTRLVYSANLNFKIAEKYFSMLEELSLIEKVRINGRTYYVTTERGMEFIRRYEDLTEDFSKGLAVRQL